MTILLTGATGFVGRHLAERLLADGRAIRCAIRDAGRATSLPFGADPVPVGSLNGQTDWASALEGVQTVIHLAARAHVLEERAADPLAAFVEVNTTAAQRLADAATAAGVRRFIFLSSIKVNGESSGAGACSATDPPAPVDPYGISKHRAEEGLRELAANRGLEVVIVRPPLVYGPGVRANFLRLVKLVDGGWPLPVGGVRNSRSLVNVWNLCDLLVRCVDHPAAANRTFMVSDGEDLSTADLVRRLARALGREPRLLNVPESWLRLAARLTGQMAEYTRLCSSLKVDQRATLDTLQWRPPCAVDDGLERTVEWFRGKL